MTEQAPDRIWSSIDIPKTIGGALAAVCAAVIGSFLGVAGTLIGAAVASVIGTVGTEIYRHSLHKGAKKLQTLAPAFVKATAAVGTPSIAATTEEDSPSHAAPPRWRISWSRVAMIAGAVFVLAMGSITAFELLSGRSVASMVGNDTGASSTISGITDPGSDKPATTPTTNPTDRPATRKPAAPADPTTEPANEATTGAPEVTTEPTQAPDVQSTQ